MKEYKGNDSRESYWIALFKDGTYKELWGTKESVKNWLEARDYHDFRLVEWNE